MLRRISITIALSILLFACACALTAFRIFDYGVNSSVPPDWITYRSTAAGFEFRYPAGWDIQVTSGFDTPWYAHLISATSSAVPITILANLGYEAPSDAATAWSNREGF